MTHEKQNMRELVKKNEQVILQLRQNKEDALRGCAELLPEIVNYMTELLKLAEKKDLGVEIPVEVLLQQMKNVEGAYRQKDVVVLADTLEYEIKESMYFYIDILTNMRCAHV